MFEYAKGERTLKQVVDDRENVMKECPFVKDGAKLLKDAWGNSLNVRVDEAADDLIVSSVKFENNQNNG